MKNEKAISRTFQALRQLPLEISFQQVESWVRKQTVFEKETPSWWRRFRGKFGFPASDN